MKNIRRLCLLMFVLMNMSKHVYCQTEKLSNQLLQWDSIKNHHLFEKKKQLLDEIFIDIKKSKDFGLYAAYYRRSGTLYKDIGQYKSAIEHFILASEYDEKSGDKVAKASNINQIGVVYNKLNDVFTSLQYFKKAFKIYENEHSLRGVNALGDNLAEIYFELDSFTQALYYNRKSLDAIRKMEDTSDIGHNYLFFGVVYSKQGKVDSALKYFNYALSRFTDNKDSKGLISLYNNLGKLYQESSLDSSVNYYNKALDTATKYNYRPLLAETYGYLSIAYERMGNANMALLYLKGQQILNNEMLDSATVKYITDANSKYGAEAQNRINTELKADKERQTLWMAILISIIISIVIISALIIWINYNKRRLAQKEAELQSQKVNDLLQKQEVENVNAMLKGQDAERKRIAQELHDRLGSILSTVKLHFSAVEEQMNALKQQQHQSYGEATLLLDEAVDEVRRISHDLYEGSLAKFGFKTALLQLIAAIEKANTVKILFIDNGVDEGIYKNHAQELYRITQELLSNTLKYSSATEITLQLSLKENTFDFMYEDNGKGFDKKYAENGSGIGYKNIAARVAKLNGNWHLDTHPGHGMTLLIEIPV